MIDRANSEREHTYWAIACGALIGACAGYVVSTPEGRRLYRTAVQTLEDLAFEGPKLFQAVVRVQAAAADSWKALTGGGPVDVRSDLHDRVVGK